MTSLITLSIACVAFIVGFSAGLCIFALTLQILAPKVAEEDNSGAVEGDQTSFSQRGSLPSGAD